MKKVLVHSVFTICLMLGVTGAMANGLILKVIDGEENQIAFVAKRVSGEKLGVKITDKNYNTVFEKQFSNSEMIGKKLKLSELPSGNYILTLEDNDEKILIPFEKKGNSIKLKNEQKEHIRMPLVSKKGNLVQFSGFTGSIPSQVYIYTADGNLVYSGSPVFKDGQHQLFDFGRLGYGEYIVKFDYKSAQFTEVLKLEE